jgi:tetratricopeptide (TPR) repeat protein
MGPDEHARLVTACYELLLIWAESEAASPPGLAEPEEKLRSRAEKALLVLARANRLAQARHLNTRAFHVRKARYLALSRGEPFDPARIDPGAPAGPQGALDWFLEGLDHYQEGTRAEQDQRNPGQSFNLASKACLETLKQQDAHYWARYVLAMCHLRGRRWIDAKMELTLCIKSRPEFTWPRLMRGFASSELGVLLAKQDLAEVEFAQAEIDFRSVLETERDPLTLYVGLVNRGVLNIRRQHWQDAVKDLRQAVKLHAKGFQGYLNLAQALRGLKRWNEARAALDEAIRQDPNLPVLYESRAKLHLELNDRLSARKDFERAIAKEPSNSKSDRLVKNLVELGRLQIRDHHYKDAEASLERALKLDPRYIVAQRFRAEALLGQNRHAEAGKALDEYMKVAKEPSAEVYKERGLIHAATGQLSSAIQCYSAALQRNPADSDALHHRGWAYLLIDATQLALADFDACLRKQANDADALVGRGNARIRLKRLEEALSDAKEAEKLGPLTDRLLYNLVCIYSQATAQLADQRTTRNPAAARRLAMCEDRAIAFLSQAVEKLPAPRRESFWRNKVETDPALAPIRGLPGYFRLARLYRRPGM